MPLLTPNVPSGLIDLMKNLAKEVLRDKPQNIYEFAAVHFEKLIQQRDGSLDKDYEQFVAFQEHFNAQQRFAVPANSGYTCQRPIEIQPILHTKKSKADMLAGFKAMESINEEDVLVETPYSDEKYQKAIYAIQRYYRRYMAQKKNQSSTTLTATTAAIIIQRTMRRLFANKIKLKTNDEGTAKHDGVVQDDVDNVSEAASYTSSSTIQMLADGQEGRENRLPGREVVLSDVSGAADDDGSTEFKEQTTVAEDAALIPPTTDNSEADRKSIADENGTNGTIPQDETTPNQRTPALDDVNVGKSSIWIVCSKTSFHKQDTSTAHIGKLSAIIGSNDQQNSLHTYTVEIDSNSSDPTQIISPVVAVGITPQSLGAYPNTLSATSTSPRPHREEHFAVHLQGNAYAENTAANPYQSVAHVRKFDPNTGESLKIYDVFSQDKDDPDFSDSLNESTMERDSLENEDLDVDSLESNENVTHVSGAILRREFGQDNGELCGETNEVHEEEKPDVHQLLELERVPTYLYGIHPSRTPIAERKNKRSRNPSAESVKMRTTKDLDTTVIHGTDDKTPEDKSEEESLESKESTSEESSVTQIENVSSVAHKIDRQGVDEDDLKSNEGASIKMYEVDGVASSNLQNETVSTGNALATNTEEMASVLEPNPLKSQTDDTLKHERELLVKKDNSVDNTKIGNSDKKDETFEKVCEKVSVINSESVSQELAQTESKSNSQKTSSEKLEIDKSYQPLGNTSRNEITLKNEDALSSKKPSLGSVESTEKLTHGLAINSSLVSDMKDPDQLQTPSPPSKCAVDSANSTVASADALPTDSEASRNLNEDQLRNVSITSLSDKTSDIVLNTNIENLPKEEGFMVEVASKASLEGALETHKSQEPDGGSKIMEIGSEDVHKSTILEEIETTHDQAKATTHRRKRSLHDNDTVSVQVPSQTLESVGNSDDQLTRNIETKHPSTKGDVTNKHDLKVETQPSSSNSSPGYFATLYNDQNLGHTPSIPGNHDQEVESQLRELQSLTDLYPGLEIKDVMSEFHTRDIQPDDRSNDEDILHDDNNNLDTFELSKSENSVKDQKSSTVRESFIEDSKTIDEKGDSKCEDSDVGQPKDSLESSKDPKVKEEVNATKAQTSSKNKTTIDEEPKMAEDKVLNKDGEVSRTIDEKSDRKGEDSDVGKPKELHESSKETEVKEEINATKANTSSKTKTTIDEEPKMAEDKVLNKDGEVSRTMDEKGDRKGEDSDVGQPKESLESTKETKVKEEVKATKAPTSSKIKTTIDEEPKMAEDKVLNKDGEVSRTIDEKSDRKGEDSDVGKPKELHESSKETEVKEEINATKANTSSKTKTTIDEEPKMAEDKVLNKDGEVSRIMDEKGDRKGEDSDVGQPKDSLESSKDPKVKEEVNATKAQTSSNIKTTIDEESKMAEDKVMNKDGEASRIMDEKGDRKGEDSDVGQPKESLESTKETKVKEEVKATKAPTSSKIKTTIDEEAKMAEDKVLNKDGEVSRTMDEKGDRKGEDSDVGQPKESLESTKETKVKEEVKATKAPTSSKIKTTIDEEPKMAEDKVLNKDGEVSRTIDEKGDRKGEDSDVGKPKELHESSKETELKEEVNATKAQTSSKTKMTIDEEIKMAEDKVINKDGEVDIKTVIASESLSGLNETLNADSFNPLNHKSLKTAKTSLKPESDRIGDDFKSNAPKKSASELLINHTVGVNVKEDATVTGRNTLSKGMSDQNENPGGNESEISELVTEKHGEMVTPVTSSSKLADKGHETVKSDEVKLHLKMNAMESNIFQPSLATRTDSKLQEEDYFGNTIDLNSKILGNDNPVIEILKADGVTLKTASVKLSKVEEEPHDYVRDIDVKFDSDMSMSNAANKLSLTDAKITESHIEPEKDILSAEIATPNANEGTRLTDSGKNYKATLKEHKSNENRDPKYKGEGNSQDDCKNNMAATNINLATKEKYRIENELMSSHDNRKSEKNALTDIQPSADLKMSKPPEIDVEYLEDRTRLPEALDSYKEKQKSKENQDSIPNKSEVEKKKNDDDEGKMDVKNDNLEQIKRLTTSESGNEHLLENLLESSENVKGDSSNVKRSPDEMKEISKPGLMVAKNSIESRRIEDSLADNESEFSINKNGLVDSLKELKSVELATANEPTLLISTHVDKNMKSQIDSLENSSRSLQSETLETKTKDLERNSSSASLADKTGVLDSGDSQKVDLIKVEQSDERPIDLKDCPIKDSPSFEALSQGINVNPCQTKSLKDETSTSTVIIPESSSEVNRLGLAASVSDTNVKPDHGKAEQLNYSSEVADDIPMKDKLHLDHAGLEICADGYETKIPQPSLINNNLSLRDEIREDIKLSSEAPIIEMQTGSPGSQGEQSSIMEPATETNAKEEITVTNLPKLDKEANSTEGQIEAVNETANKTKPLKNIESSTADQDGVKKQLEHDNELNGKRLTSANSNKVDILDSTPSSAAVSVPTEVTSCDDSNAETSADFSSIGKDLDFFEDTINYLKSATAQLTTMDKMFTEDENNRHFSEGPIAEAESEVTAKPEDSQNQVKELLGKRGAQSIVDDGLEAAETDVLDQAATVIQSAVRGYRVRRDLNSNVKKSEAISTEDPQTIKKINIPTEGFQSKTSKDSFESETNIIKKQTPTGVVHPIFVIHPAEGVSGEEHASKEDSKSLNKETGRKALEQHDSETKNQPIPPDNFDSHSMPHRIAREKPIKRMEKPVKLDNLVQTGVDSIGSVRHTENPIENENKTKGSDEIVKIKASITRERPIERKSIKSESIDETKISVKNDSIDKGQMEPSPGRTKIPIHEKKKIVAKPLNNENDKPKSKILKSKVPSTSNLLDRERSAKSKRNQFGRKVRSVSVKEQNQKINVFDLEAIKNDLLSTKKVRSSKNSGRRTKITEQNSNSSIKHSKEPSNHIQKSKKAKGNIDSKELHASGKGNCDKIDGSKELFNINDPNAAAVKKLSDELEPVTETSPTVDSLKENVESSQQLSATTIQKTFRGYKARKHLKSVRKTEQNNDPDTFNTDIPRDGAGHMPRKTDDDASKNSKTNDTFDILKREVKDFKDATLDKSATKIQKTFRGFRTRKSLNGSLRDEQILTKKESSDLTNAAKMHTTLVEPHLSEEIIDQKETNIKRAHNDSFKDANNTDLHKSATTIQKNFRGYKTRKSLKKAKSFESISDRTFIIKSKSKETGETLDDDAKTGITIVNENQSKIQRVSPKIDLNLSKDEEIVSSSIFENLKRDMESFKNAALDKSAIQIQKTFRGYKTRKYLRNEFSTDKLSSSEFNQICNQTFTVIPEVPKTENKKDSRKNEANSDTLEADNYNNTALDESAITIQKTFRGYKTRKGLKSDKKIGNEQLTNILDDDVKTLTKESDSKLKVKDNNLQAGNFDDLKSDAEASPALDEFATTIQKTFRGYKARKELIAEDANLKEKNSDLVQLSSSGKLLRSSQAQSGHVDKRVSESVGDVQKVLKNESSSEVNQGMKKSSSMGAITSNEVSEKAAITIQKTYKGFKARKELLNGGKLHQIGSIKTDHQLSKNDMNSHKNPNSEDAENWSASSTDEIKVDIEDSMNSEREYASDEPAERSTLTKQTIRAASAGALLGAAASTIQKAYRDYHSRKENTISKIKSYSHGAQRDNPPKEAIDTSDESSTFIGPDTSFDLSDIDSIGTKSTPTLEQEISNSPSFALSIHSEGHTIENECANTALVSENSLSISPQRILRKRSILDPTAPLLVDILNADESNDSNGKPQWYVGEDLIVPSNETDISTFQTPLASSSSSDKLSSIDSHFISNLQPTPSINSAVVSTSSLLFDTKDTEMHDTIKNTPKHLNKHSRAVSADEEEKRTEKKAEVRNEVSNCQEIDTTDGKTEKQNVDEEDVFEENGASSHGLTELEASLMLTSTDPFSPRNAIEDAKDASQEIMTELCKNCADGVHEVHEEDITTTSNGGRLSEVDKSENQAVNVEDTKDVSQSTDEIKQFVLMEEELKTAERSSEKKESGQVNETNSSDTETSSVRNVQEQRDIQMSSPTSNDCKSELPLVTINLNDDDTNLGPSIALIPPSSEEETSDRDSTHELEMSQRGKIQKDQVNNMATAEDDKQLEKSKGADLNDGEKSCSEKQESVDICQEIVTVKSNKVKEADIHDNEEIAVKSTENHRDDSPSDTKPSGNVADLKAPLKKGTKFEVDSTELKELPNSSEVDDLTDKFEEFIANGTNSENGINVQQKPEDILKESTTVKSPELSVGGAAKLPNIDSDENATTRPTDGSQCDNEAKMQNVAVGLEETKLSFGDVSDVKEESVEETITKCTTEPNEEVPNFTEDAEKADIPSNTIKQSSTKESEDSEKSNSVDKLNEHSSDLSSNIAHPLDFTDKSEDPLKKKIDEHEEFKDDFNKSSNDEAAKEDPIKPTEVSHLSSEVSEVKTAEYSRHESQKNEEDNITNSRTGDLQAIKMRSSSDSIKEENEKPADVEPLEELMLKSSESSHKVDTSNDIVSENVDKEHVSKSKSDTLGEEGGVQNKSRDGTAFEDKTSLAEADSVFGNNELLTTDHTQRSSESVHQESSNDTDFKAVEEKDPEVKFEDLNKSVDLEKSIDCTSEDQNKADINPKSTQEEITPITEHEVTESKQVMEIKDTHEDPLSTNDSKEDLEIASKLLKGCLPNTDLSGNSLGDKQPSVDNESVNASVDVKPTLEDELSKQNASSGQATLSEECLKIQEGLDKLIDESVRQIENDANSINVQDLPVENSPNEVVEVPCVKKILPPTPLSATSDQDESELESTTTKAESTTTSPGYDGASDNDALEIPLSLPDSLEAMAEKVRETEEMVARMHQRRASEHKISIEIPDQPAGFDDGISEPIRPMQELQKSSSTEVEDDIILQKLQRGNTTRESSAQSESVVFGDSTSQLTESEDTFNESLDIRALHRMNTIAVDRSSYKPANLLHKSVTIDDAVKYIDPEKSTEESGGSFSFDDATSADVRKKMMAYSISEADSDYYDAGEPTARLHDDFNISTALDTFPSSDTDITIVSAATKIQAGARGFLTRRRLRRASMGTKSSLNEETKTSFGNDAIGESLDRLIEDEDAKRKPKVQYHRQVGVNSLPSALGKNSTETETPSREQIHADHDSDDLKLAAKLTSVMAEEIIPTPHGEGSSIDGQRENRNLSTASENDVNGGQEADDESAQVPPNLEATLAARRLTLQRGDAMRNDSTPDDDNGNAKQVDPAKIIPATAAGAAAGTMLIHQITTVESTTSGTTPTETTPTTTSTTTTITERRNYSDAALATKMEKIKWFAMRQNSMPVQIDSEVFRVLPKHMRKRIKSAEGEQKKRIRLPRD